jgi:hypothetical protein
MLRKKCNNFEDEDEQEDEYEPPLWLAKCIFEIASS